MKIKRKTDALVIMVEDFNTLCLETIDQMYKNTLPNIKHSVKQGIYLIIIMRLLEH